MTLIPKTLFTAVFFLLISTTTAIASEQKVVYLVTGSEEYPPLTGQSLPSGGLFTEIVTIIFKRMGYQPVIDYEDWAVGMNDLTLVRKAYIGTFPYARNVDREKLFVYSKPVYSASRFLYKRKGDPLTFSDLNSQILPTQKVGCRPEGYHLNDIQPLLDKKLITLEQPRTLDICFKRLVNKEVDFVVAVNFVGDRLLSNLSLSGQVTKDETPVGEDDFHIIFPRTDRHVSTYVNGFNRELEKMEKAGDLDNIIQAQLAIYYAEID